MSAQSSLVDPLVRTLRNKYISQVRAPSFYEKNNGLCSEFADDLELLCIGYALAPQVGYCENFRINGEELCWDWGLLESWGLGAHLGLSWDQVDSFGWPWHCWGIANEKHYDTECPRGVSSFFELPIFVRLVKARVWV